MVEAESFAEAAIRATIPPTTARDESLVQLRCLPVRELRTRLRELRAKDGSGETGGPLEREELVRSVEALERAAESTSKAALQAERAVAEVRAMRTTIPRKRRGR